MKITVKFKTYIRGSLINDFNQSHLTVDKWYEGNSTPSYYVIKCDDGRIRKFPPALFITKEEWRDLQLEKIL